MTFDFDGTVLAACDAVHGEPVLYQRGGGPPWPLTGIFDKKFLDVKFQDGVEVSSMHPVLSVRASALPADVRVVNNEIFVVRGQQYKVTNTDPDGVGSVLVHLRRALD